MAQQFNPLYLQFHTIFLILLSLSHSGLCLRSETQALLEFKRNLVDPLNYLDSWKESEPDSPCMFSGITCDKQTGLVTEISLDNRSLSGTISPSISVLQNLTSFAVQWNHISGILPDEFGSFVNLKVLNVSNNSMNGSIPDLSKLVNLEAIDVADNYFSGAFPAWVGGLTKLNWLSLGDNDYDEGKIPESIGNLKNLNFLYLAGSNLIGEIPESIFGLEALGTLDISKNKISGDFPASIGKMKSLWKIELYNNNLTGVFPPELADLTLLEEIDIATNRMHGTIPPEFGNLKKLTVFQCFENSFTGELPPGFGDMQHLIGFSIYRNGFTGEFPQNLGRFSPLNGIDISENKFSGPFPKYLCQNGNLQNLLALDNEFSGDFPESYAECKPLERLRVNTNKLNGPIPDGVWGLPNVKVMDFSDNDFSGGISPRIGDSLNLDELMLSDNKFSGELPKELGKLTKLERIYLDNNRISGKIPPELGQLKQLSSLYLQENTLTGSIPSELAGCSRLVDINLASNSLSGNIPTTFTKMASLNSLNLSRNGLTGSIPRDFDKLKLSSVDFSDNHLSGSVPPNFLTVAGDKAFLGNEGLCVDNDQTTRKLANSGLGYCSAGRNSHRRFSKNKLLMFCFILLALVILIGGLLFVSHRNYKQHKDEVDRHMEVEKGRTSSYKLESFQPVEFDVDEISDLDPENLIGSGGTGKVYRLDLKKGCGTVAVKQLWKGNGVKLMTAEMDILGKIRHRNILKLYACLMKGGSNLLVFDYMPNGNLFEAIHREIKAGRPELDWYQRFRIALGAAKGIAYLHHDCSPAIIHRDIKSTNILLDEEYEAKIADFGVAKVADQASPRGSEVSCFVGTHGYIAPEMAYSFKVTEKSDVYSFGVVLLELVTGRRPVEDEYGEGKDIVYWVSTHLFDRENVLKVLDQKVTSCLVEDDMIKVLRIATLCTARLPNLRPSMREVVNMLSDAEPSTVTSPVCSEKQEKPLLK